MTLFWQPAPKDENNINPETCAGVSPVRWWEQGLLGGFLGGVLEEVGCSAVRLSVPPSSHEVLPLLDFNQM